MRSKRGSPRSGANLKRGIALLNETSRGATGRPQGSAHASSDGRRAEESRLFEHRTAPGVPGNRAPERPAFARGSAASPRPRWRKHAQHKAELAVLSSQIDKQELRKFYFSVFSVLFLLAIILPLVFKSPRETRMAAAGNGGDSFREHPETAARRTAEALGKGAVRGMANHLVRPDHECAAHTRARISPVTRCA